LADRFPAVAATSLQDDLLMRAAVLSAFDLNWIHPRLADAEVDDVAAFLSSSCERVVDATGTPRWRLRDDERMRILRGRSRASLRAALDSVMDRPDDLVQAALEQYLSGSFPPLDQLDAAGLSGVLQLERWVGEDAALPTSSDVQARLEWRTLVEPLQRLVARGFFGRQDLLTELRSFIAQEGSQPGAFLIEGVGGSGKSTALARFILDLPTLDDLAVYISFDRGWLIDRGPWALFDEIVRQVGAQDAQRRPKADGLRQQAQELAKQASYYSDSASRGSQLRIRVQPDLLRILATVVFGRRRLVVVFDTLEELARRDDSLAYEIFDFLAELSSYVSQVRVIAAGRSLPNAALASGRQWPLTGLNNDDALQLLQALTVGAHTDDGLLREIIRLLHGNPLSLHLAAAVLKRTGEDPTRLIAVAEGNVQGQLYSRLLEHIRDPHVRAIAHPGLVVRRLTPAIIREVLADPCGIAPLSESEAARIFEALREEATLCEPSPDGDGALVHRQDVRTLMLPSIQQDRPGTTRAIHKAAVLYYEAEPDGSTSRGLDLVARREELYHRLMLEQDRPALDQRWDSAVADDLTTVIDELPPRSQLYLTTKVRGLRLDPAALAEAEDDEWQHAVRPAAMLRMERGQVAEALELVQEQRASDGRPLLPDLEVEALERLGRLQDALSLAMEERERAPQPGAVRQVRALVSLEAKIRERMRQWSEAWKLLDDLANRDRDRRTRTDNLDDEVRVQELIVLTSMLRVARNEARNIRELFILILELFVRIFGLFTARNRWRVRERIRDIVPSVVSVVRPQRRPDRHIDELTRETVGLAEATPQRLLTANPSLLRDLASEIGRSAPQFIQLAASAVAAPADTDLGSGTTRNLSTQFRKATDTAQEYQPGLYQWLRSVGSGRPTRSDRSALFANYMFLRKAIGWVGTLLPVILLIANPIALRIENSPCGWLPGSVSGYYYSPVRNIFVGALCALGLFLIAYVGYDLGDRLVTDAAGVFAFCVAFFPTTPTVESPPSVTCRTVAQLSTRDQVIGDLHAVSAGLFFVFMAWMAIRFTNTDKPPYPQKLLRNRIYMICATVIIACLVAVVITNLLPASFKSGFPWLFLFEAVAIFAFGVSWFVKGQTLIRAIKDFSPSSLPYRS
jgi:hypothetical protein